jgi:hypothetical protein
MTPTPERTNPMQILPVDVTALVSAVLAISIAMVPVIGVTARFALEPAVEALVMLFLSRKLEEIVRIPEGRVEIQERQPEFRQVALQRLAAARDLDRQLAAPRPLQPAQD